MQTIKLSKDSPNEVNLSLKDFVNDLYKNNGIYGAIKINLKIGAPVVKHKGILSIYIDENYSSNIVITYIDDYYSEIANESDLIDGTLDIYKFKNNKELFNWLENDKTNFNL